MKAETQYHLYEKYPKKGRLRVDFGASSTERDQFDVWETQEWVDCYHRLYDEVKKRINHYLSFNQFLLALYDIGVQEWDRFVQDWYFDVITEYHSSPFSHMAEQQEISSSCRGIGMYEPVFTLSDRNYTMVNLMPPEKAKEFRVYTRNFNKMVKSTASISKILLRVGAYQVDRSFSLNIMPVFPENSPA